MSALILPTCVQRPMPRPPVSDTPDEQLIVRSRTGDAAAFAALVHRYLRPIYGFVCRQIGDAEEAHDVTQEVFVRVWKHQKTFDVTRRFKTWIFHIAKNAAIDAIRKKRPLAFSQLGRDDEAVPLIDTIRDPAPLPSELFDRADLARVLTDALQKLSPTARAVLLLRYNGHFTFREIAESLGEPLDTVKSRHRRAIIALHALLTDPAAPLGFRAASAVFNLSTPAPKQAPVS